MDIELFISLLTMAERIDKLNRGLETSLDVRLDGGPLYEIMMDIINLLVDRCEYELYDNSIIYTYAFDDFWGSKPHTYSICDEKYVVNNVSSLYYYLLDKYDYDYGIKKDKDIIE